ncbi:MAG: hypothetical protein M3384_13290 [Acidobacteriota bacterium]|nr:hypothetical protein [Acidobacteriota bacterium]
MMKFLKKQVWLQAIIFCVALNVSGQIEKPQNLSDENLVLKLSSKDHREATQAAIEIFKRDEKLLPSLLKLKGNKSSYNGYCLGDPEGADFFLTSIDDQNSNDGSRVTVEVAALYLISAIYYENIAFANVPYLTGNGRIVDFQYNTAKRVNKAWKATERWYKKMDQQGLQKLRQIKQFPLKTTKIHFTGTNAARKRNISDCLQ